jgi:hypothetical protein
MMIKPISRSGSIVRCFVKDRISVLVGNSKSRYRAVLKLTRSRVGRAVGVSASCRCRVQGAVCEVRDVWE